MSGEERDQENRESTREDEEEVPPLPDTPFPPMLPPGVRALQRAPSEDVYMRTLLEPILDIGEEGGP